MNYHMGQWSTRNIVDLLKSKNVAIANSAGQSYGNVRKDEGILKKLMDIIST